MSSIVFPFCDEPYCFSGFPWASHALILPVSFDTVNINYYQLYPHQRHPRGSSIPLPMQTKQLHLRLSEDEMKTLTGIAERCGLNATSLGTVLLKAALTAVLSNRSRFTMHLVFKIEVGDGARSSAGCCELNEPKETKYPRKTL